MNVSAYVQLVVHLLAPLYEFSSCNIQTKVDELDMTFVSRWPLRSSFLFDAFQPHNVKFEDAFPCIRQIYISPPMSQGFPDSGNAIISKVEIRDDIHRLDLRN
ncbi:hypothetical protein N7509_001226 [Penicillium cosmopolitanum]|uniref:Uncharacterized protein n=1 Tax=Penicillium cosmopolitanum TaxID=1131564 RepID=A0A9W9WCF6_9EURO|nr:uncharacterized protein N7509_001226 [Penicillium cosmopolitanum]KAJ5414599.1 hypothetical protein N7509_001226 [Penicillium cosmopolitanum]